MGSKPTCTSWTKLVGPDAPTEDFYRPKGKIVSKRHQRTKETYVIDFVHPWIKLFIAFTGDVVGFVLCSQFKAIRFQVGSSHSLNGIQKNQGYTIVPLLERIPKKMSVFMSSLLVVSPYFIPVEFKTLVMESKKPFGPNPGAEPIFLDGNESSLEHPWHESLFDRCMLSLWWRRRKIKEKVGWWEKTRWEEKEKGGEKEEKKKYLTFKSLSPFFADRLKSNVAQLWMPTYHWSIPFFPLCLACLLTFCIHLGSCI